jgi:hypothetical protein
MNLLLELIDILELKGETVGLKLAPFRLDVDRKVILTTIGDKEYEFTPKEKNVAELFNSVTGVAKHSPGRALVYLKQHATGVPVKESMNEAKLSPWDKLNDLAKRKHGEAGFATMHENDMAKYINLTKANAEAKRRFGEFGFATLSEEEMEDLINSHPEFVK